MNIKQKLVAWLKSTVEVKVVISDEQIAKVCERVLNSHRYDFLPHGACWLCSNPISKHIGYSTWRGRLFCSKDCVDKYASLISSPAESYQYIQGDPVETVTP